MWLMYCTYMYVAYMLHSCALNVSYKHIWEITFRQIGTLGLGFALYGQYISN